MADKRESIPASNDPDQLLEREGVESEHNRGYDEAVKGEASDQEEFDDVDPDSPDSENDRDDMLKE